MQFTTPITDYGKTFLITGTDKILTLGSCFANVVGERMACRQMKVVHNPMGTLFNPYSIWGLIGLAFDIIERNTTIQEITDRYVFDSGRGEWFAWIAASKISGHTQEECANNLALALNELVCQIQSLDVLMITFGTDHYYCLKDDSMDRTSAPLVVANCHKMPSTLFKEKIMPLANITNLFHIIYDRFKALRPSLKILFTLSPYRYLKYGLHQSKVSKARLMVAIDECVALHKDVYYFPAYEILNDELRDYRYYDTDMVHPSEVAEEYIWQQFCNHYIDHRLSSFFEEWETILKMKQHIPSTDDAALKLKESITLRQAAISQKFPEMF